MLEDLFASSVDHTLTKQNANSRGFSWEMDVIRDEKTGRIVGKELIERKLKEEGYKLGKSWGNDQFVTPYGLYRPLATSAQTQKRYDK